MYILDATQGCIFQTACDLCVVCGDFRGGGADSFLFPVNFFIYMNIMGSPFWVLHFDTATDLGIRQFWESC